MLVTFVVMGVAVGGSLRDCLIVVHGSDGLSFLFVCFVLETNIRLCLDNPAIYIAGFPPSSSCMWCTSSSRVRLCPDNPATRVRSVSG